LGKKDGYFLEAIFDASKTLSERILTAVFKLTDTFISFRYKFNNR